MGKKIADESVYNLAVEIHYHNKQYNITYCGIPTNGIWLREPIGYGSVICKRCLAKAMVPGPKVVRFVVVKKKE